MSKVYHRNSNAYVIDSKFLLKKKTLLSKKTGGYIVNSKQISIDTEDDIRMAEKIFKNWY